MKAMKVAVAGLAAVTALLPLCWLLAGIRATSDQNAAIASLSWGVKWRTRDLENMRMHTAALLALQSKNVTPIVARSPAGGTTPLLCIAFATCGRPRYLNATVTSILRHMETVERGVAYETVLVDQATDPAERALISRLHSFDRHLVSAAPMGTGWPFLMNYESLCTAPYVLTLEDDWSIREDFDLKVRSHELLEPRFVMQAINVLRDTNLPMKVFGVILRPDEITVSCKAHHLPSEREVVAGTTVWIRNTEDSSKCKFGTYTNGPAIYDRRKINLIGFRDEGKSNHWRSECSMSARSFKAGFRLAQVKRLSSCKGPCDADCNAMFIHTGGFSTHNSEICKRPVW